MSRITGRGGAKSSSRPRSKDRQDLGRKARIHSSKRIRLFPFDAARYLTNSATIAEYLNAALEVDDPATLLRALGDVARARGMSRVARLSGLGRESLYKALAPGSRPSFETVARVVRSLGVRIEARAA